jgi:hypothetical protein
LGGSGLKTVAHGSPAPLRLAIPALPIAAEIQRELRLGPVLSDPEPVASPWAAPAVIHSSAALPFSAVTARRALSSEDLRAKCRREAPSLGSPLGQWLQAEPRPADAPEQAGPPEEQRAGEAGAVLAPRLAERAKSTEQGEPAQRAASSQPVDSIGSQPGKSVRRSPVWDCTTAGSATRSRSSRSWVVCTRERPGSEFAARLAEAATGRPFLCHADYRGDVPDCSTGAVRSGRNPTCAAPSWPD